MAHRGFNMLIDLDALKKTKEDSIADLFLYIQHLFLENPVILNAQGISLKNTLMPLLRFTELMP